MQKSHCEILKEMLETKPYVKISEIRGIMNYRSRVSDLREKYNMDIRSIRVAGADGRRTIHAYVWIKPVPTIKTKELFSTENHDGVVRFSLT